MGDPAVAEVVRNPVGQQQSKSEVSCLECAPRAVYLKVTSLPLPLEDSPSLIHSGSYTVRLLHGGYQPITHALGAAGGGPDCLQAEGCFLLREWEVIEEVFIAVVRENNGSDFSLLGHFS